MRKTYCSVLLTCTNPQQKKIAHPSIQAQEILKVFCLNLYNFTENTDIESDIYPGGLLNVPMTPGTDGSSESLRKAFKKYVFRRLIAF